LRVSQRIVRLPGILPVLAITVAIALPAPGWQDAWAQEKQTAARPAKPAAKPSAKPAAATPESAKPAPPIPATYEVAKGDTLFRIAGKTRPPGITLNQMVLALYKANVEAFLEGNINQLLVGKTLKVPGAEAAAADDPVQATQQLRALIARPLVPVPAPPPPPKEPAPSPPKPRPEPPPTPAPRPSATLTPEQAAERFQQGLKLEQGGDLKGALQAYTAAGDAGHGLAQKRLGDIYNTGNDVVVRDYETALKWYQKARAQGVEIPKPLTNPGKKP
jgi:pilus assembly protein FimV